MDAAAEVFPAGAYQAYEQRQKKSQEPIPYTGASEKLQRGLGSGKSDSLKESELFCSFIRKN